MNIKISALVVFRILVNGFERLSILTLGGKVIFFP